MRLEKIVQAIIDKFSTKDLLVVSEDMRKVGTVSFQIGAVGLIVGGDRITTGEALTILLFGLTLWAIGLRLHFAVNRAEANNGEDK